jgi:VWFA-related protein
VVDDLALSYDNIVRVRNALRTFVERQMEPGDLMAVIRTGGGVAILEQFTTDKQILLEAIDLLKWRFNGRTGMLPIDPGGAGKPRPQGRPEMLDYGYTLSALGALDTIQQVIQGMQPYAGRKSVVLLSDGFRMDSAVNAAVDRVADLAIRGGVSIYTVDPNGLSTRSRRNGDIPEPITREPDLNAPRPPLFPGEDEPLPLGGLQDLADRTGGLYFANRNDIPECVRQAADDQMGYYLLAYAPREGTFEAEPTKAKFHRIVVRARKPGLRVRWKSGFQGVPDNPAASALLSADRSRERVLLEALASPFTATGLRVRLTSIFYDKDKVGPFVHSMLHFKSNDLTFTHEPDGRWHASVDIVSLAYRGFKQTLLQHQRVEDIQLPDDLYQRSLKEGFVFLLNDAVKEPGSFLVRAVVRDRASGKVGSASQFLQVPDWRKGKFAVSGILMQQATANILAKMGVAAGQSGAVEAWSEGGPAVRRYRRGQAILWGLVAINPKLKGTPQKSSLTSQVRLYRNGKLFYTGPVRTAQGDMMLDPQHVLEAGILRLGGQLIPGEYLMQVTVTDRFGRKKDAVRSQWSDFDVVDDAAAPVEQLFKLHADLQSAWPD